MHRSDRGWGAMRVRDVVRRTVEATPNLSLWEAARMMEADQVGLLPVTRRGRLVGVLEWDDVLRLLPSPATYLDVFEQRDALYRLRVGAYLRPPVVTVAEEDSLLDAAAAMVRHRRGWLPAVDARGECAGVIGFLDVLAELCRLVRQGTAAPAGEGARGPERG